MIEELGEPEGTIGGAMTSVVSTKGSSCQGRRDFEGYMVVEAEHQATDIGLVNELHSVTCFGVRSICACAALNGR